MIPLYFSGAWLLSWLRYVVESAVLHAESEAHSFPYLHEASQAWFIAVAWLGAVPFFWSMFFAYRYISPRPGRIIHVEPPSRE